MSEAAAPGDALQIHGTDFLRAQADNRRNTWILIAALIALGFALGYVMGWALEAWGGSEYEDFELFAVSGLGLMGGALLAGIGVVSSAVTLFAGDKVVLAMAGAVDVSEQQEPVLHNVVEEMAIASGLPKPKVVVIETEALNAFATGMRTDAATIGVTRGLLKTLSREQLQGVIAHEMGHILNLDTRYMAAVGIMVGLIALVSDMALRSLRFGGGSRRSSGKKGGGGQIVVLILFIVFAILAPIAAQMVRFAVSRQREFLADATSVQLTRNPLGLIGALQALSGGAAKGPEIGNRAIQHLFIVNPVREFSASTPALFATHPALGERVARLQNLGKA